MIYHCMFSRLEDIGRAKALQGNPGSRSGVMAFHWVSDTYEVGKTPNNATQSLITWITSMRPWHPMMHRGSSECRTLGNARSVVDSTGLGVTTRLKTIPNRGKYIPDWLSADLCVTQNLCRQTYARCVSGES